MYKISNEGNRDFREYLRNKLKRQNKNINLVESKKIVDANLIIKSERIPNTQYLATKISGGDSGRTLRNSQSEPSGDYSGRQTVGSDNAGNGSTGIKWSNSRNRGGRSVDGTQPHNTEKNEEVQKRLGGIISGRTVSEGIKGGLDNSKNIEELEILIPK